MPCRLLANEPARERALSAKCGGGLKTVNRPHVPHAKVRHGDPLFNGLALSTLAETEYLQNMGKLPERKGFTR
jgi:hypothetical protein